MTRDELEKAQQSYASIDRLQLALADFEAKRTSVDSLTLWSERASDRGTGEIILGSLPVGATSRALVEKIMDNYVQDLNQQIAAHEATLHALGCTPVHLQHTVASDLSAGVVNNHRGAPQE